MGLHPPFVAIDFETADYGADSACAVALVRVQEGRVVDEKVRLICPPRRRVVFTSIHGLRWEDLEGQPCFAQVWQDMMPLLDGAAFMVAHNASFDRRVLLSCCQAHGLPMPELPFRCTVQMARRVLGISPANLAHVCRTLGIDLKHHEALSDARACAQIMLRALQIG